MVDALREAGVGLRLPLGILLCAVLFVDEVTLLAASPEDLVAMFRVMAAWLRDARWIVSEGKTHVVVVGPGATPAAKCLGNVFHVEYVHPGALRPAYRFDCPIESETRDLGYFFARNLRSDATISRCLTKAYPFLVNYDFEWVLFQRLHLDGFHAHFRSVVEWAAPVWTRASTSDGYPLQRYFVADHRFPAGPWDDVCVGPSGVGRGVFPPQPAAPRAAVDGDLCSACVEAGRHLLL